MCSSTNKNSSLSDNEQHFIDEFEVNFQESKNKKIVLYGIGEKTKLILENVQGYNFVGLMDKDCTGSTIYGQKVLSYKEVINSADIIIIVANMSVVELIYKRIEFLKKCHEIDIKYINGTTPLEKKDSGTDPYWLKGVEALKNEIDKHEIVSFDIFDTLLMRKVLIPTDLFDLVEQEIKSKLNLELNFKSNRIIAEKYCYQNIDKHYNIMNIYGVLQSLLNISYPILTSILEIELEVEEHYCVVRKEIFDCYLYALSKGKNICLTTDMYLSEKLLIKLLSSKGINNFDKLLISCELKKSKYNGDLFEYIKQIYQEKKILHIGDNEISDIKIAARYNINTFQTKSAYDLVLSSDFRDVFNKVESTSDNLLLGKLWSHFLNNPFSLNKTKGALRIDNMFDLGFLAFGPLVLNYLNWLINIAQKVKIDRLLFFARDGYLLEKIYKNIVNYYNIDAPEGIYFLTSRRGASVPAIKSRDDIVFIIKYLCKTKNILVRDLILIVFGIKTRPEDNLANRYYYEITEDTLIQHILDNYVNEIKDNSSKERENYLRYIKSVSLERNLNIGCVNFVGRGITQYFISQILEKDLHGFYFATEYEIQNIISKSQNIHALYGELLSPHTGKTAIATKYLFGEVIFSSPDEQFIKFDSNMQPVFHANNNNPREFALIKQCHDGIMAFVTEMISTDKNILTKSFSPKLLDFLFGMFISDKCVLEDKVKKCFVFNDYYNPSKLDTKLFN